MTLFTLIWSGVVCQATLVPRLTLDEMAAASDCVMEGKVGQSWSAWDPTHRFIWTHYELEVRNWLKGSTASRTVVVSEPGGTIGGLTMRVAGVVPYQAGEDVVVFLYRTPVGFLRVAGYGQGKFIISPAAEGSERRVHASVAGVELVSAGDPAARRGSNIGLEQLEGLVLPEFEARVRSSIARHTGKGVE